MRAFRALLPLCLFLTALPAPAAPDPGAGARWIHHARADLLPWWTQAAALGKPLGRFPTFRCHDGSAYDAKAPCPELAHAPAWIHDELGRDYIRMQARQVFAYAMGFNLTGDARLLRYAEAGARDIRSRALDPETGSPATYWQDGRALPAPELRTAQDIAYAGAALAAWYYVSRDAATLADLDRLHRHLMSYFDPARDRMKWTLAGPESDKAELVAQLDPLNAYMILVTPLLSEPMKARWLADMRRLVGAIRTQFCAGERPRCQGTLGNPDSAQPGGRHNDFGHSGKAFWMSWLAAEQLGDAELAGWARDKGRALLREAYLPRFGSWARRWTELGSEAGNDWWIHAELDQLASTLAQRERGQAAYLAHTEAYWFDHFVEPGAPEVWSSVSPDGRHNPDELRQHQWKNGYHAMEHALVGYLTAQALAGQTARLYFAPSARGSQLGAYFFGGRVSAEKLESRPGGKVLAVDLKLQAPADSPDALAGLNAAQPHFPGKPVALDADSAAHLAGDWEGKWFAEDLGAEGRFTMHIAALADGKLSGNISYLDTGNEARTAGLPLETPVRIADGRLLVGDDPRTLRRDGGREYLDWREKVPNPADGKPIAMLIWVSRVSR